ncbi:hypothetical protein BCV71DRAFT_214142 [Rhizopus microsporus]|uniref:FAR1 domain-containing protein n=1 Tax=Rhizopus microsporus TaxID=58291 RepID=A0A1X0S461_RHIZD|nr:hypothetical protein BCV71DRAFT_214142 [Rhizopus microsporus]
MPKRVTRRGIIWKIKHICHRAGAYKSRADVQTKDESSKSRPIQKPSKKIDCRCHVTVTCYFVTPNWVTIKLHNEHNHLSDVLMISLFCLYPIIRRKVYCKGYVKSMVEET